MTKHGWFSYQDLGEVDALLTADDQGRRIVRFPVAYETVNGVRRPIYRDVPEHVEDAGPVAF